MTDLVTATAMTRKVQNAVRRKTSATPTLIFDVTSAVHRAFAFLAGAQLDVITPLGAGPLTAEQVTEARNLSN
ncbi:MAG: hypothetical protein R3300_19395 [Candidatus Promineifilaceae bacterium]|nr:hypothetical protein [Candidatus Promineifilaceae bacterium]